MKEDVKSGFREEDRKVAHRILLGIGGALALFFLAVALLTSHFVNSGGFGVKESKGGSTVSHGFYGAKEQYGVLPSLDELGEAPLASDVLYSREYQVSRSLKQSSVEELDEVLSALDGEFDVARSAFKAPYGYHLMAVRSQDTYIVYSYVLGVVAVGSSTTEARSSLSARFGGSSADVLNTGFVSSVKKGSWVINYKPDVELDEEVLNEDF